MKTLFFGLAFLIAAGLTVAIIIGVALKLVIFFAAMTAVVGGALYIAGRIYGPPDRLPGEGRELDHLKR